ncbi:hypothetical protein COT72_04770 [archaeon CG10_big_fil_rev_8_21_14_0_10_43_11]|nr:MAG: hypothetical protein COT72_04770 [archaeon CG10_big_fil_rev_8_21_14_0_10_43_11]
MRVVGITGKVCAGKGALKQFLKEYNGYTDYSISDMLRGELRKREKELTRDNLIALGNQLREEGGAGILVDMLAKTLSFPAIVESIRNPGEVLAFRELFGKDFVLITVVADPHVRFSRMHARGRENDPQTWEEFCELEHIEHGKDQGTHGQLLDACEALADITIENNGSFDELKARAKALFDSLHQ